MIWKLDGTLPLYIGLAAELRTAIICGTFKKGEKLPGVRELAFDAKVNPNTMQRALFELEREGLLKTKGTTGRFVTEDSAIIADARHLMLSGLAESFVRKCRSIGAELEEIADMIRAIYHNGEENE